MPPYFDNYSETLEQKPISDLRQNLVYGPLIKRVYAECSPLFQVVKLINTLKRDKNDTILKKLQIKPIHTMFLLLMLQGVSWTHMTLSVEYIIVIPADFNRKSNILSSYYIYLQYFNLYHFHVSEK